MPAPLGTQFQARRSMDVLSPLFRPMSLPSPTHPCWTRLATGQATLQTRQLGLQLLFKRIQDPKLSPADRAREIHAFFAKYAAILAPEIAQLERL
jgi:hypothetical protein